MALNNLSLRRSLLIAVIIGLAIPGVILSFFNISKENRMLESQFVREQERLVDILVFGMREPLWNLSPNAGAPLLDSIIEDPRVIEIVVSDQFTNTPFLRAARPQRKVGHTLMMEKPVQYRGKLVGKVFVEFDTEHLVSGVRKQQRDQLLVLLGQTLVSLLLILGLMRWRFLLPMQQLTIQSTLLANLDLKGRFQWDRRDEIGALGRHLEWVREQLARLFAEVEEKNRALEQDIAERKRVEDALRRSESKYRELFVSNLDGIVISDMKGRVIDVNPAFVQMVGYSQHALKELPFERLLAAKWIGRDADLVENQIRLFGYSDDVEREFIRSDGSVFPAHVKGVLMRDENGEAVGIWRMVRDVTERKKTEAHLQLAAQVFENSAEGILVTDATGTICSVNRAFTDITGYADREAIGKPSNILASGRHEPDFFNRMWADLAVHGRWQGELWNRRKNGTHFPVWMTISEVRNDLNEVVQFVGIFSDITERKKAEEQIAYLALYDVLTGLPNRMQILDRGRVAIAQAERYGYALAVLFLDVDRFKTINDSLGHSVGDELLKAVAERIKAALRGGDSVGRQGGDEFIVLLPQISSSKDAALVAERILQGVGEPYQLAGRELIVTPSIGISVYPDDGVDYETLVKNADAAMYHAKASGRNNYQFFTSDMNARAHEILSLEAQLRRALERSEFVLHYQPQIDVATGEIIGAEALIRWNHPDLGLMGPVKFIDIAEERGLIVPIGTWALSEACRQNAIWQREGRKKVPIAVNLSALQFRQQDIPKVIRETLSAHQLDSAYLEVEVTESVIMQQADSTLLIVEAIKALGVKLAIDDFGTGYSSLSYLKRFRPDKLKVDRSFVRDVPDDAEDCAITRAIINLAKSLNVRVIAEGVETIEQWEFLHDAHCDEVQGYLISKPVPASEFAQLLLRGRLLPLAA